MIFIRFQLKIEALQHRRFEKDFFLNIGKPEKQAKYIKRFAKVYSVGFMELAKTVQADPALTLREMIRHIGDNAATLGTASDELQGISARLSGVKETSTEKLLLVASSTEEVNTNATTIAAAMGLSSTNMAMIAAAAQQMGATVNEIAKNSESGPEHQCH